MSIEDAFLESDAMLEGENPLNSNLEKEFDPLQSSNLDDAINDAPNLNLETFHDALNDSDIHRIEPHIKGGYGNFLAKNYFTSKGCLIENEVITENGRVDLLVTPTDTVTVQKIEIVDGLVEIKNQEISEKFSVEIKNYSGGSYGLLNTNNDLDDQINNGYELAGKSYLGLPSDFLYADDESIIETIHFANKVGDGIILMPYSVETIDQQLNNLLINLK